MKDKDELLNAMLREISDKSDSLENAVKQMANLMWLEYCAYIDAGFSEERAFTLVGIMLTALVSKK